MTIMIPKIPKLGAKTRLVVYLKPEIKKALESKAKLVGSSTTKYVEKIIRDALGV
jgi:hypothetical protein